MTARMKGLAQEFRLRTPNPCRLSVGSLREAMAGLPVHDEEVAAHDSRHVQLAGGTRMCIAVVTTALPGYALAVISNRDEVILRPTSRPHWWPAEGENEKGGEGHVLSSRDLHRPERGTWLGISRDGRIAVLTNVSESGAATSDSLSRGTVTQDWLSGSRPETESTTQQVDNWAAHVQMDSMAGFSMICGQVKRRRTASRKCIEPLAVVSNRGQASSLVQDASSPLKASVAGEPDEVIVLSNTTWDAVDGWPKIGQARRLMRQLVQRAQTSKMTEAVMVASLFGLLDTGALSEPGTVLSLPLAVARARLRETIFVPPSRLQGGPPSTDAADTAATPKGLYGTQRQTVVLIDWAGDVVFWERALWDEQGQPIERGSGDVVVRFRIDGWDERVADRPGDPIVGSSDRPGGDGVADR